MRGGRVNAAVVLRRCQRKVLVFDAAQYRNRYSHGILNYLTRDGIVPAEFIARSRKEIGKYGVELVNEKVVNARKNDAGIFVVKDRGSGFLISTGKMETVRAKRRFYCRTWKIG